jgi:hypothetical protein
MKREYRLYINNADPYFAAEDEASAYRLLVERVETILAEEQQLFWQSQAKAGPRRNRRLSQAHERDIPQPQQQRRTGSRRAEAMAGR